MLSAEITEEETEVMCREQHMARDQFVEIESVGPHKDGLVLKMPCTFLFGRPTSYVRCTAYTAFRPKVCRVYRCRIAVQYQIGEIECEEGLRLLRRAFTTGDASVFNWGADRASDTALITASIIPKLRDRAKELHEQTGGKTGLSQEQLETLLIAEAATPTYEFSSDITRLYFQMLMNVFDRGDVDLEDVIPRAIVELYTVEEQLFAHEIVDTVLFYIRSHFRLQ